MHASTVDSVFPIAPRATSDEIQRGASRRWNADERGAFNSTLSVEWKTRPQKISDTATYSVHEIHIVIIIARGTARLLVLSLL